MPRKSLAADLQAEEAAANSPLRRSSRIVSGNATAPAGIITRRTSQTTESQGDTPAKITRGRRTSQQETEEKTEIKPVTRARRASTLADEETKKETESTPSRRGRKPSVTSDPIEESEKLKPVRGRRTSTASKNEDLDEEKPQKTAPVRSRRSSANVESEKDVKSDPKTPARTTTRRRSSVAENPVAEEVSIPARRTTRGRKASDAEETIETSAEDTKKPVTRGRRKSVNVEEERKPEVTAILGGRRSRKSSTDDISADIVPKTPTIHSSMDPEIDSKYTKINGATDDEISPTALKDVHVKLTPLKNRKIIEKVEAELDLSVIDESVDDNETSKHDESSNANTENVEIALKLNQEKGRDDSETISPKTLSELDKQKLSSPTKINSALETKTDKQSPNTSPKSTLSRSTSKKRLSPENEDAPSPRKSPRLSEKILEHCNSKEEMTTTSHKLPTPRMSRNLTKDYDKEHQENEKSHASFVSSGSDGSFKFHLSNVSMANSGQQDSNKEETQEDTLNLSKESTSSNKENIELNIDSPNVKTLLNKSGVLPLQEPITVSRVSNVFKPNQKEFSFTEPMEVVDDSIIFTEPEKDLIPDNPDSLHQESEIKNSSSSVRLTNVPDANSLEKSLNEEESSVGLNHKLSKPMSDENVSDISAPPSPKPKQADLKQVLESIDDALKQNWTETEGSDTNLLIEETHDTVDFSIKPKTKKADLLTSKVEQRRSKSPINSDGTLAINQPLEQVKVALLGKSSSPIVPRRRSSSYRKSKSPVPIDGDSTDSENEKPNRLSVARSTRRSKCSSKTPTPSKEQIKENHSGKKLSLARRSKSKSKSPTPIARLSSIDNQVDDSKPLTSGRRSKSKSPRPSPGTKESLSAIDIGTNHSPCLTRADTNCANFVIDKVKTPECPSLKIIHSESPHIIHDYDEPDSSDSKAQMSANIDVPCSKSQSPLSSKDNSIIKSSGKLEPRRSLRSKSRSPLPEPQEHAINKSHPKFADSKSPSVVIQNLGILESPKVMSHLEDLAEPDSSDSNTELSTKSKDIIPSRENSIIEDTNKLIPRRSLRSKSKSPSLQVQENEVTESKAKSPSLELNSKSPSLHHKEMEKSLFNAKSDTNIESETKSLSSSPKILIKKDNVEKLGKVSENIPLAASTLDQSFEKPKGTEEMMVTNDRKSKNGSDIEEKEEKSDEDSSVSNLPDSLTTEASNAAESQLDTSNLDCTASEQTNVQDKTEYHTAVGTTNNESDFNSLLNTDIEVTQSGVKDELTHYEFELDSDEDDVPLLEDTSKAVKTETNIVDRRIMAMQKESHDQNNDDAAVKQSDERVSQSPRNEHKKIKVLAGTETDQLHQEVSKSIDHIEIVEDPNMTGKDELEDDESQASSIQTIIEKSTGTGKECETDNLETKSSGLAVTSSNEEAAIKSKSPSIKKCENTLILTDCDNQKVINSDTMDVSEKFKVNENMHTDSPEEKEISNIQETSVVLNSEKQEPKAEKKTPNKNQDNSEKNNGRKSSGKKIKSKLNKSKESRAETVNDEAIIDIGEKSDKNYPDQHVAVSCDIIVQGKTEDSKSDDSNTANKLLDKSADLGRTSRDDLSTIESVVDVSVCRMTEKKVLTTKPMNEDFKLKDNSKSRKKKPTLDEFASAKLAKFLDSKSEEIEGSSSDEAEEEESGEEYSEFIDGMAEEGEEDTPSEDSNQIIDEGESIGYSSEEELNTDDDYENDSFICDDDDDEPELLSGDEYDLGSEKKQKKIKRSRIIDPSTLGDEDIIRVHEKKKVETEKPKKRSRIITVSDSSEDEEDIKCSILESKPQTDKNDAEKVKKDQSLEGSILLIEDSHCEESSKAKMLRESRSNEPILIEESNTENTSEAIISVEESKMVESSDQLLINQSSEKDASHHSIIIDDSNNASNQYNTSISNLNTSLQKRHRKSSLTIQENILIDGKKDPSITKRINTLVESFCSTVKKGEIALNLSLEYEDVNGSEQDNNKTESVNILSNIKICPNKPSASQEKQLEFTNSSETPEEKNEKLSTSLEDSVNVLREDRVEKQSRKRLSKSLNDINEDIIESKRRKKHKKKKSKQKTDSEENVQNSATSKSNKQDISDTDPTADLRNAISSFGIMNQLITDVKNRPRRVMKPTKTDVEAESSWTTTKVSNLKPSTSPVTKLEKFKIPAKLHPKDFKNQMLSSDSRVKRIDTKTLLKKKGAFY